jgi:hypothetical protein
VEEVERNLGKHCIRAVHVSVNPGTGSAAGDGGYWLYNTSFGEAATLMTNIIAKGKSPWRGTKGQRPFQGKLIVLGSSAGGMIAAAALEREVSYAELVDRTIMISSPLGVDLSEECSSITGDLNLKPWLDRIFRTGSTCTLCNGGGYCGMSSLKDVLEMSNRSVRPYMNNGHEIVILIGQEDKIGCKKKEPRMVDGMRRQLH